MKVLFACLLLLSACALKPPESEHLVTRDRGETYQGVQREHIRETIKSGIPEVRKCYDAEVARDKSLAGKMVAKWVIGETGSVKEASIQSSTISSPALQSCVVEKIKSWKFQPLAKDKEAEVHYPFVFYPSHKSSY